MEEKSLANLRERTGRTLDDWIAIIKRDGPATEKERREWLKSEHEFTTNYALWIAGRAGGGGRPAAGYDPEARVEAMFADPKATLRPLYDTLLRAVLKLGKDVRACPGKTIVPLYREHVFAQIKPTTRTRIDLGFALKNTRAAGRLIDTGGLAKGDRITHRIAIEKAADIDAEARRWLKTAYEMDAAGSPPIS